VIQFSVPGEPVTWKRAQRGRHGSYTHPAAAMQMERVRAFARQAGIRKAVEGPVEIELWFCRGSGLATDLGAGDVDNLVKLVLDALSGGFAFRDDRQVVDLAVHKRVTPGAPATHVRLGLVPEALVNLPSLAKPAPRPSAREPKTVRGGGPLPPEAANRAVGVHKNLLKTRVKETVTP